MWVQSKNFTNKNKTFQIDSTGKNFKINNSDDLKYITTNSIEDNVTKTFNYSTSDKQELIYILNTVYLTYCNNDIQNIELIILYPNIDKNISNIYKKLEINKTYRIYTDILGYKLYLINDSKLNNGNLNTRELLVKYDADKFNNIYSKDPSIWFPNKNIDNSYTFISNIDKKELGNISFDENSLNDDEQEPVPAKDEKSLFYIHKNKYILYNKPDLLKVIDDMTTEQKRKFYGIENNSKKRNIQSFFIENSNNDYYKLYNANNTDYLMTGFSNKIDYSLNKNKYNSLIKKFIVLLIIQNG